MEKNTAVSTLQRAPDHILYVEDEDVNWEVAELSLGSKYQLTRAKTAREAFTLLTKHNFAAVLMDIQLQGSEINGIEITQILKGRFKGLPPGYCGSIRLPDVPIIFVTAYSARYSKADLVAAGGVDMITKPVNFTGLAFALSRILSRSVLHKLQPATKE